MYINKQVLYDILLGELLVSRRNNVKIGKIGD